MTEASAALLSGGFARRIALSAALGSGAIGSLLVVHGENWSVFAASVLVGLGRVATAAIVTFLIRNRTSDAAYPFFFAAGTASLGLGQLSGPAVGGLLADWFGPSAIGWFAAAIYGAGTLAAADGFFARTWIGDSRAIEVRPEVTSAPGSRRRHEWQHAMAEPTSELLSLEDLHVGRRFTSRTHSLDERQDHRVRERVRPAALSHE